MAEKEKNFEESLSQLEDIVARLEQGEVPLEEAMKLFQDGMKLAKVCSEKLKTAELEIKKLVAEGERYKLEPFEKADE